MTDPSVVDHMAQLRLKLLEKRLEKEQENLGKMDSPVPRARNRQEDMLQSALRRRKDLLQELRDQHLLEELSQPSALAGGHLRNCSAAAPHIYQLPFPAPQAEAPRIIQQAMPPQPATIIQQLPQLPPLIAQIPPAQPFAAPRSGSIKEDMVEMMLMQNAQMHQIIMQNMMLKSLPSVAFTQPAGSSSPLLQHRQQDLQLATPMAMKSDRPQLSAVHHHHHYSPPGLLPPAMPAGLLMPSGRLPPTSSASHWASSTLPAVQIYLPL
ncbi:uncharacterized protein C21orf58 homolog [Aythya fuligula]|uniref:Uncharacterized protein C21orf58 homolog n=1 Tax=Aythya fuligula TaxID=219594 RepID=A0A6J3D605_AYTFU|nr:uncharacterized protein C21orf58 homolog [Aythya fuligula]